MLSENSVAGPNTSSQTFTYPSVIYQIQKRSQRGTAAIPRFVLNTSDSAFFLAPGTPSFCYIRRSHYSRPRSRPLSSTDYFASHRCSHRTEYFSSCFNSACSFRTRLAFRKRCSIFLADRVSEFKRTHSFSWIAPICCRIRRTFPCWVCRFSHLEESPHAYRTAQSGSSCYGRFQCFVLHVARCLSEQLSRPISNKFRLSSKLRTRGKPKRFHYVAFVYSLPLVCSTPSDFLVLLMNSTPQNSYSTVAATFHRIYVYV